MDQRDRRLCYQRQAGSEYMQATVYFATHIEKYFMLSIASGLQDATHFFAASQTSVLPF